MRNDYPFTRLLAVLLPIFPALLSAQPAPPKTTYSNFKCEVYLEIYNGLYDWYGGHDYSGTNKPLSDGDKTAVGAVTVANKNDTDGDGMADNLDTDVRPGASTLGRNEMDLMKVVVKKVDPGASLAGNVTLKINSSTTVKAWSQPWKGTEISLPYTFPASQLEKTVYLEALDASTYQGIEVEVSYNSNKDVAIATAVWATLSQSWRGDTQEPIPGTDPGNTLPTLETSYLADRINKTWISVNNNRYGHGDYNRGSLNGETGLYDKKFGGRILFEFKVSPANAGKLVKFDITRQRKTITGRMFYNYTEFTPSFQNTVFPNESPLNQDNELPNDDADGGDEDDTPNYSNIYSADPPGTVKKVDVVYNSHLLADTLPAFKVSQNTFREFVRMQVRPQAFSFLNQNKVLGSRASNPAEWHCTYYTKRYSSTTMLEGDYSVSSYSVPLRFRNDYTGNGTISVSLTGNVATNVYYVLYDLTQDQWYLSDFIGNGAWTGTQGSNGTWTASLGGVNVIIAPGSIPFQDSFSWVFNTFKTQATAKVNEINNGAIVPTDQF